MPSINALGKELKDRGLTILLVDIAESRDKVARTITERAYTLPVLLDAEGEVTSEYRVSATPTVFLIGRDGRILGRAIGPRPWTKPAGRALLDAVLKGSRPGS